LKRSEKMTPRKDIRGRQLDAFGRVIQKSPRLIQHVEKLKSVPETRVRKMMREKQIREFLGLRGGMGSGLHHSRIDKTIRYILMVAGKREILGTFLGDNLKKFLVGNVKMRDMKSKTFIQTINALEINGLIDRKTGKINKRGIEECLRQNRMMNFKSKNGGFSGAGPIKLVKK